MGEQPIPSGGVDYARSDYHFRGDTMRHKHLCAFAGSMLVIAPWVTRVPPVLCEHIVEIDHHPL